MPAWARTGSRPADGGAGFRVWPPAVAGVPGSAGRGRYGRRRYGPTRSRRGFVRCAGGGVPSALQGVTAGADGCGFLPRLDLAAQDLCAVVFYQGGARLPHRGQPALPCLLLLLLALPVQAPFGFGAGPVGDLAEQIRKSAFQAPALPISPVRTTAWMWAGVPEVEFELAGGAHGPCRHALPGVLRPAGVGSLAGTFVEQERKSAVGSGNHETAPGTRSGNADRAVAVFGGPAQRVQDQDAACRRQRYWLARPTTRGIECPPAGRSTPNHWQKANRSTSARSNAL